MSFASAFSPSARSHFDRIESREAQPSVAAPHRAGSPSKGSARLPATAPVSFDVIDTLEGLAGLGSDWNDLFAQHGRPGQVFQTHAWCQAWARSFLADPQHAGRHRLFIVTAHCEDRLVLVWPLMEERSAGSTRLVWLGTPVTQYGDVVMDPTAGDIDAMLAAAWKFLRARSKADYVHLAKAREDALIAPFLARIGAVATVRETAPHLDFSEAANFASYADVKYSRKARKNRARNERKLAEFGAFAIDRLEGGTRAQQAVREALALKRRWLKTTGRVSRAINDPATEAFFVSLASAEIAQDAGTVVSTLRIGETLAACEISFVCKGHLVVHVLVYASEYERFSPGKVLVENSIEACFAHGVRRYDLMAPADAYKVAIADRCLEVVDWALPVNARGALWVRTYLGFARPRLKRLQAAMPIEVRRYLSCLLAGLGV